MYFPLQVMTRSPKYAISVCKRLDKRPFFHPSLTITYEEQTRALNLVSEKHNLTLIQKYIVLPKKNKNFIIYG